MNKENIELIMDLDFDKEIIKLVVENDFPVKRVITHVPRCPSGNSSIFLPEKLPNWEEFESFVNFVKDNGITPIAGMDTTCQGNLEAHKEHFNANANILDQLNKMGFSDYLVSAPLNIGVVKAQIPNARVHVSYSQLVTTLNRAKILFEMGADSIQIHPDVSRYIKILGNMQKLARKVDDGRQLELILPLNIGCNWGCIQWYFHHNLQSHRTTNSPIAPNQENISDIENSFDYPMLYCWKKRLEDPTALLRSGWIAPGSIERYISLGYRNYLLFTAGFKVKKINKMLESYTTSVNDLDFKEYLAIPQPYGDYWPSDVNQALPRLTPDFVTSFLKNFPYEEHYPLEAKVDEYLEKQVDNLDHGDPQIRAKILAIIEEKMAYMHAGAMQR